ncbi:MAG: peptidase inhibitor family I36 protein [Solirubrobacterales bacterium]
MRGLLRTTLLAGIAMLAFAGVGIGPYTSSAAASINQCELQYDGCAFANANYEGGFYHWRIEEGYSVHSFTGLGSVSGCTTGSFNDCVSSLVNYGPVTIYYYKEAGCTGTPYTNLAGTNASYVGETWNDTFSSLHEGKNASC